MLLAPSAAILLVSASLYGANLQDKSPSPNRSASRRHEVSAYAGLPRYCAEALAGGGYARRSSLESLEHLDVAPRVAMAEIAFGTIARMKAAPARSPRTDLVEDRGFHELELTGALLPVL